MDKLPDVLIDTYRQCKDGTNKVISWLATASYMDTTSNDGPVSTLTSLQPRRGGRGTGKKGTSARRAAKRAQSVET